MSDARQFNHEQLGGAKFHGCGLAQAEFDNVDMSQSKFNCVNLRDSSFADITFQGAKLNDAVGNNSRFGHDHARQGALH